MASLSTAANTTEVLIIGGGPTGLTLALELSVQKVPFRIIDKATVRSDKSRALSCQPRSLELLMRYGDSRELAARGNAIKGLQYILNKKVVSTVETDGIDLNDTEFRQPLILSQHETETWLEVRLAEQGLAVERGVTATSIEQDVDGATVRLTLPDGACETVRCQYCIGCDGAHSFVRKLAGLRFEGERYASEFALCDAHVKWEHSLKHITVCMGKRWMVLLPLGDGRVRMGMCTVKGEEQPSLERFRREFKRLVPGPFELYGAEWLTTFRLHHRIADEFRTERLLVAGDAAHIHSPIGGQGMNTGIQDAVNLGWKLGCVVRGEKPDSFLDTYTQERRPVGLKILSTTDRMFNFLTGTNWLFVAMRNLLMPWVLPRVYDTREKREKMFRFMMELGLNYRRSPIVDNTNGVGASIQAGDRAPDGRLQGADGTDKQLQQLFRGPNHHIVVFSGLGPGRDVKEQIHDFRRIVSMKQDMLWRKAEIHNIWSEELFANSGRLDVMNALHFRYGMTEAGFILVRPDGYVAQIGVLPYLPPY
ncbi:FAD binding domain-containing protein [Pseudomassariella vexata]|uniref:FAD binding domain-domain-containing protein n=1 Tax=Pseudomassariella vexata TaxID=1141098 RepID=A0A1Y2DSX1_9PEZI|nr:FAD binding domain-containing protein [Pseudomassariella vexata]ORY62244.1 FAD binding domain-domain-containing protein [Pseudomassariella vexata]